MLWTATDFTAVVPGPFESGTSESVAILSAGLPVNLLAVGKSANFDAVKCFSVVRLYRIVTVTALYISF